MRRMEGPLPMKRTTLTVTLLVIMPLMLTACGTSLFNRQRGTALNADGSPQTLAQFTLADLTAARAYAESHHDVAVVNCTTVLMRYVGQAAEEPPTVGVFSAYAKARVKVERFKDGVPEDLHIACAPLVIDARLMLVRLAALLGGGLGGGLGVP